MIKLYQTIHVTDDFKNGNCLQTAIACLFEIPINNVPHFVEYDNWVLELIKFIISSEKYDFNGVFYNKNVFKSEKAKMSLEDLPTSNGIDGYFVGVVYSPKWYNPEHEKKASHAVIIDNKYNIVHDVNYNNKDISSYPEADIIGFNGILNAYNIIPRNI